MAGSVQDGQPSVRRQASPSIVESDLRLPVVAQYAIVLALVAAATFLAFIASSVVPAPGLTLIFVLPVVLASTIYGLGPSLTAIVTSVLAFDFFFTQPYFTLRMSDSSEIWAAGLLLITAAIVGAVAWQSRRHAMEARRAAAQAEELRRLAHAVIEGASQPQIVQAAATALSRIFDAPAALFSRTGERVSIEAVAGDTEISDAETEAAKGALADGLPKRAQAYPHEQSRLDLWPILRNTERGYVVAIDFDRAGQERPADADRLIEIVAAYIVANLSRAEM